LIRHGLCLAALALLAAAAAAPARAQEQQNRAEIVLDASDSMNEDAGNGGTRLDAAKQAVHTLLSRLPAGSQLGLRVYGSKLSGTTRAAECRDSELEIPVGPLDKGAMGSAVDALAGKGRTPIGRSLLATPGDFGTAPGRRTVVLVSDGGDNCAPPDPCKAAARVSKQGVDLSISVVGLQVSARVRRQLQCIARAGGGSYVDVQDAGKLGDELAAALARALRTYDAAGTPVTGGPAQAQAVALATGLYQDVLKPGDQRWYAIDVPAGKLLFTSVTAIPSFAAGGDGRLTTELIDARGDKVSGGADLLKGRDTSQHGRVLSQSNRTPAVVGGTAVPAGRYVLGVTVEAGSLDPLDIPLELAVQLLGPGEAPGLARTPGALPTPTPTPTPSPTASPRAQATPGAGSGDGGGGVSWAVVAIVTVAGLALGLGAVALSGGRGSPA
jgi:hypothetical protein